MATAMEKCALCSSNSLTILKARGFEATEDAVKSYFEDAVDNWTNLPGIEEKVIWSVYKVSPSQPFKHFSLLFMSEDKAYSDSPGFTFELIYIESSASESSYKVVPQTIFLTRRGSKLGAVEGSAKAIMMFGLKCLVEFGDYHCVTHNCQHFCCDFAKELGVEVPWTHNQMVGVIGGVMAGLLAVGAGVFGAAVFLGRVLGRSNDDDDDDDD